MNVAAQLDLHARSDPGGRALVDAETGARRSWSQLRGDVAGAQRGLERIGLREGDRLGLLLDNRPEFVVLLLAALRSGIVPALLNVRWSAAELRLALEDSGAAVLVCERRLLAQVGEPATRGLDCALVAGPDDDLAAPRDTGALATSAGDATAPRDGSTRAAPAGDATAPAVAAPISDLLLDPPATIAPALQRAGDDLAEVMYTSGSSGRPKGVLHHHGHHIANASSLIAHFELRRQDVGLAPFPLFHQSGQTIWSIALALGGPLVVMRRWRRERFAPLLAEHGVTYTHLITTAVTELAQEDEPAPAAGSLRLTLFGGGVASAEQALAYERRFGGVLCSGYGRSEGGYCWEPPDRARRRFDRNGIPLRGTAELRIVDLESGAPLGVGEVGEIRMRGDAVARGYWRRPDLDAAAFDEHGFMRTGDLGLLDADGHVTFKGRADGMIKSGGENVYPSEVERVLLRMPAVAAAAVVGLPDARLGQRIGAAVVLRAGVQRPASSASADAGGGDAADPTAVPAVDAWCREQLSGFKRPRAIATLEALPLLGSGKVDYAAVAALLSEHAEPELQPVPDRRARGGSER